MCRLINNCINIFVQVFAINDLNQRWKVGHTEVGIECIQHKIKNKPVSCFKNVTSVLIISF